MIRSILQALVIVSFINVNALGTGLDVGGDDACHAVRNDAIGNSAGGTGWHMLSTPTRLRDYTVASCTGRCRRALQRCTELARPALQRAQAITLGHGSFMEPLEGLRRRGEYHCFPFARRLCGCALRLETVMPDAVLDCFVQRGSLMGPSGLVQARILLNQIRGISTQQPHARLNLPTSRRPSVRGI